MVKPSRHVTMSTAFSKENDTLVHVFLFKKLVLLSRLAQCFLRNIWFGPEIQTSDLALRRFLWCLLKFIVNSWSYFLLFFPLTKLPMHEMSIFLKKILGYLLLLDQIWTKYLFWYGLYLIWSFFNLQLMY